MEGGAGAAQALARLGLLDKRLLVVAAAPQDEADVRAESANRVERLVDALGAHLSAVVPQVAVAQIGGTVYALLPAPPAADAVEAEDRARRLLAEFGDRVAGSLPMIAAIGSRDFRDLDTVRDWIAGIFAVDREQRAILQAFIQANVIEAGFAEEGHAFIDDSISALGKDIPAFALDPHAPADRRRYVEASLLLYELFDQSNHAARNLGVAADFLIVEVLADRFVAFVAK